MQSYHIALLIAALISISISWRTPRSVLWVLLLAASFIVSASFSYAARANEWPLHTGVTMLCDIAVFMAIQEFGRQRWETRILAPLVSFSALISLAYTTGTVFPAFPHPPEFIYTIILEAVNYLALILIGGVGILNRIEIDFGYSIPSGALRSFHSCRDFLKRESNTQVLTK